jgi:SPP1 gp7 family putative phage head morphogenesis protein
MKVTPQQKKKLKDLLKLEKENKKKFALACLAALLAFKTTRSVSVAAVAAPIARQLRWTHARAGELAAAHLPAKAAQQTKREEHLEELAVDAAAGALAATLVRSVLVKMALDEEKTLVEAAREAARENLSSITRTADTELYGAYNDAYASRAKNSGGDLLWVAILDKHTCDNCDEMDGQTAPASEGFKVNPPLHPRCRCTIDLI